MKGKILIVDDNSDNRYILKSLLEGEGLEVITAANGKEALDKARADPPDLIVSDILMPVMDGYTFCRQCKSDERLKGIPFIFYTATYTEPKDEKFALSLGADRFVLKPQDPETLIRILQEIGVARSAPGPAAAQTLGEEMEFFRQYNQILFGKLEKKMLDLETAHRKLKCMEEQYRLSFENATDIVWTIDADLAVRKISPSVERMLGYKPQDFIDRSVCELVKIVAPESMERAMAEISRVLGGQTIPASVYSLAAKDGTIRHGEISGAPIRRNGDIVGMVSVVRDITDRKQAEEELRRKEARFRDLFHEAPVGYFEYDTEGLITRVNRTELDMLGYSREEMVGQPVWKFIVEEETTRQQILAKLAGALPPFQGSERTYRRKDGTLFPVLIQDRFMMDEQGNITGIRCAIQDITDRKQSEEMLLKTMERLRRSLSGTVQAISMAVETRDPYTAGHQRRAADLARAIATEMGFAPDRTDFVRIAATIHDIGKISVPAEILSKPSRLREIEYELIKSHSQAGYDILKDIDFPWPVAEVILQHHERMDGSGYPQGLRGEAIHMEARILAVADVVEAIASHRPYRPALGIDAALEEIQKNRGTLYDPDVTDACLKLFREKGYSLN